MHESTVIGLGAMGSALAHTLLGKGHRVTVWNRTPAKAEALIKGGAVSAPEVSSAVAASPVVVVCVTDYEATGQLLRTPEVATNLDGRVLVQLSTGRPQEARDLQGWAQQQGASYLDGAILAWPDQVGTLEATILVSGDRVALREAGSILKHLGGQIVDLGEAVGAASAMDCAMLSYLIASIIGFLHGARICESEGLPVDSLGSMIAELSRIIGDDVKTQAEVVQSEAYDQPLASLAVYAGAMERILGQALDAEITTEFPKFATRLFRRALVAGYGQEEVASLIKVLRADD